MSQPTPVTPEGDVIGLPPNPPAGVPVVEPAPSNPGLVRVPPPIVVPDDE